MGPVGCGKTVANCAEVFRRACEQEPDKNGIRKSRWAIVRNTYPELKSTTIKTWLDWFPEDQFGTLKKDSPITHRIFLDGIDLEIVFLALDSEKDVQKLMSFEFTGIYINELQYIHEKIFIECLGRVNRFPSLKDGVNITWAGVIADTNPPSTRHWIYRLFEVDKPSNFSLYKFDPAVIKCTDDNFTEEGSAVSRDKTRYINNKDADYIKNLSNPRYYLDQIPASSDERIKVYACGEYGILIDGRPVHPEYIDKLHYSNRLLNYNPFLELGLGWDFGLTPAVAIVQFTALGQFVVLAELYSERMGLHQFAEDVVMPFLDRNYSGWKKNYVSFHDPSGQYGKDTDEKTCQDILMNIGIQSLPAGTNNSPTARRSGLKYHLTRLTSGEPGFMLSSLCPQIREGLMGHYQYGKIQAGGLDTRYHEKPLKNMHSHICEALEYIAMHYSQNVGKKVDNSDKITKEIYSSFNKLNNLRNKAYGRIH
jgi:hypothetical protein